MNYYKYCSYCGKKNIRGQIDGAMRYHCLTCKTIHYDNPNNTYTKDTINRLITNYNITYPYLFYKNIIYNIDANEHYSRNNNSHLTS